MLVYDDAMGQTLACTQAEFVWVYRLCCTMVAADLHYLSFARKVDIIYLLCLKNVKQFCLRSALLLFIDPPATSFTSFLVHLTLRPSSPNPSAPFCSTSSGEADEEGGGAVGGRLVSRWSFLS